MPTTQILLIGGFLGAGKTTLLAQATGRLARRGKRIGLITNDQAANLVDTAVLQEFDSPVQEVAGGCFCCRFDELMTAMDQLMQDSAPDVLIGEPVGSCTDLSATVLQPLKQFYANRFQVAPFSVLVDVKQVRTLQRMREALNTEESARFPDNVLYIYEKQLEEADLIVLNKADLVSPDELAEVQEALRRNFSQAPVMTISARDGSGVDAWLDHVTTAAAAGQTITDVDYDQYADGEAALGWLNGLYRLRADSLADWKAFLAAFVGHMQRQFQQSSSEIAHLKLYLTTEDGSLAANLTSNDGEPSLRGHLDGSPTEASLLVNIRAAMDPERLRPLVVGSVRAAAGSDVEIVTEKIESFAPARPQPVHRFTKTV